MKTSAVLGMLCLLSSVYATPIPSDDNKIYSVDGKTYLIKVEPANNRTLEARQSGCFLQAFSGNACDGDAGDTDTLSSSPRCIESYGRHSYLLSAGCGYVDLTYYTDQGCVGGGTAYEGVSAGCYNVNTGTIWSSTIATYF